MNIRPDDAANRPFPGEQRAPMDDSAAFPSSVGMAERRGAGLQNRPRGFEPRSRLQFFSQQALRIAAIAAVSKTAERKFPGGSSPSAPANPTNVGMAERRGAGLQNRPRGFEPRSRLQFFPQQALRIAAIAAVSKTAERKFPGGSSPSAPANFFFALRQPPFQILLDGAGHPSFGICPSPPKAAFSNRAAHAPLPAALAKSNALRPDSSRASAIESGSKNSTSSALPESAAIIRGVLPPAPAKFAEQNLANALQHSIFP